MVRDLLLGSDDEAMRQYCLRRFGVDPAQYGLSLVRIQQKRCFPYQDDGANIVWIKNRFEEAGVFQCRGEFACDAPTARLHIFFPFIEETPEMTCRLSNDDAAFVSQVARSKLPSSMLKVRPIDSVAQAVAPFPTDPKTL